MKRILVATDLSARSERAVERAALLARASGSELTLVHVVDDDQPRRIVDLEIAEAGGFLRRQVEVLAALRGLDCRPEIATGEPFDAILRTAAAVAADLIVMGTHRKRLLRDVFIGTTIERVVRTGPYPVLMVNSPAELPYRTIMAPVDMSEASAHALKTADTLGLLRDATVTIAHAFAALAKGQMYVAAVPVARIREYVADEQRNVEKEVVAFLGANGFRDPGWSHHVREGGPLEVIPAAIDLMRPDLIVIGTHGRSTVARALVGSVAESLLRTVETDVLAVPPSR
jgi:nucleotide-binding universal stress UspA family protein